MIESRLTAALRPDLRSARPAPGALDARPGRPISRRYSEREAAQRLPTRYIPTRYKTQRDLVMRDVTTNTMIDNINPLFTPKSRRDGFARVQTGRAGESAAAARR